MESQKILQEKEINHAEPVIYMDKKDALQNFIETMEYFEIDFNFSKLSKSEIEKLFLDYGYCISIYHLEKYHQERGAFLKNEDILRKYGLSEDDIDAFDFC